MSELQKYLVYQGTEVGQTGNIEIIWRGGIEMNVAFEVDAARAADQEKIAELQERLARSEAALRPVLQRLTDDCTVFGVEPRSLHRIVLYYAEVEAIRAGLAAADGKQQCDQCDDPECPVNQRDGDC